MSWIVAFFSAFTEGYTIYDFVGAACSGSLAWWLWRGRNGPVTTLARFRPMAVLVLMCMAATCLYDIACWVVLEHYLPPKPVDVIR